MRKKNKRTGGSARRRHAARGSAAIRREYTLVQKAMKRAQQLNHANLYGAMQALAWVLRDHAMSPSKAFGEVEGR